MIYNKITETIGNTPVLRFKEFESENSAEIYGKLEFFNHGGSIKDRIAAFIMEKMLLDGTIKPGDTIVEPTSGNTGIGIAMAAAANGLKAVMVMPDTMSIERQKILKAYGAEIVLTPGKLGMNGAIAKAEELVEARGYKMFDQFNNKSNPEAHKNSTAIEIITPGKLGMNGAIAKAEELVEARGYKMFDQFNNKSNPEAHKNSTAIEIIKDFDKNSTAIEIIKDFKNLDAFVAGVGTGGTLTGNASVLKENYKDIEIIAVEPDLSPVISGGKASPHKLQGIGAGFIPSILDTDLIDKIEQISSEEAYSNAIKSASDVGVMLNRCRFYTINTRYRFNR